MEEENIVEDQKEIMEEEEQEDLIQDEEEVELEEEIELEEDEQELEEDEEIKEQKIGEKPVKALTPYIVFLQTYKEKYKDVHFKDLASLWQDLPAEDKRIYIQKAQQDKIRYQRQMEQYVEVAPVNQRRSNYFPISRVRLILKADQSQKLIFKKDYLQYLTLSLEHFLESVVKNTLVTINNTKRKKLQVNDLFTTIKANNNLRFLQCLINSHSSKNNPSQQKVQIKKPNSNQNQINKTNKNIKSNKIINQKEDKGQNNNKKISDFFKR